MANPSPPPSLRVLQATSIALQTTAAGLSASLSVFLIPRLMESPPSLLAQQFTHAISSAHRLLPLPLVLPGFLHAYLAYQIPRKARVYVLAAFLTFTTLPWTKVAMIPLNREMARRSVLYKQAGVEVDIEAKEDAENAHVLADKWASRNLYRPVIALISGCLGLYAALS
ncbi:hypothetical protein M426DRAFT_319716 [Hypoxylon sp. CI-4A]|nr:hypothetical protein M426DRAFT_319716 [Hypoxylon sp. CI-4A]